MLINQGKWFTRFAACLFLLGGHACIGIQSQAAETPTKTVTIADLFARYDLNGNGLLDEDECVCEGSKLCDFNKDGEVSRAEFFKGVARQAGSHESATKMITRLGGVEKFYALAKSGQLEQALSVSMDDVFAQWDRNNSGVLEADECVCQCSKSADVDKDGKVSKQEMSYFAERNFGSVDRFLAMVRQRGGVEAFYNEVATEASTIGAVFARYDTNHNGSLEPNEWVCENSKAADYNRDGKVTEQEMVVMVKRAFGSVERFEQYVKSQGGAAKFHARRQR